MKEEHLHNSNTENIPGILEGGSVHSPATLNSNALLTFDSASSEGDTKQRILMVIDTLVITKGY
jgi:hypothetical protein